MLCCICGHRDAIMIKDSKDKKVAYPICMFCFEHDGAHYTEEIMEDNKDDERDN